MKLMTFLSDSVRNIMNLYMKHKKNKLPAEFITNYERQFGTIYIKFSHITCKYLYTKYTNQMSEHNSDLLTKNNGQKYTWLLKRIKSIIM